jgi:hypothetical protein
VRLDRPILCPDVSCSRIVSSSMSRRLADGLGSRFTFWHMFGRANLVFGQALVEIDGSEF